MIFARFPTPSWRSSTKSPRPTFSSRFKTASIAARFSATNNELIPRAESVAIRLAIVWDFPSPADLARLNLRLQPQR